MNTQHTIFIDNFISIRIWIEWTFIEIYAFHFILFTLLALFLFSNYIYEIRNARITLAIGIFQLI